MRQVLMIAAALGWLAAGGAQAAPQKVDTSNRCQDASKFANASFCKAGANMATYKLDAKGVCHGPDGKKVKKEMCKG